LGSWDRITIGSPAILGIPCMKYDVILIDLPTNMQGELFFIYILLPAFLNS
jgi:hypothetical protein